MITRNKTRSDRHQLADRSTLNKFVERKSPPVEMIRVFFVGSLRYLREGEARASAAAKARLDELPVTIEFEDFPVPSELRVLKIVNPSTRRPARKPK